MGRLFWKFFFAFWLAVLTAGVGVGTAVWWRHNALGDRRNPVETVIDLRADLFVASAANILQYAGTTALRDFLRAPHSRPIPPVFAVDDEDREILQRPIAAEVLQHVRSLYSQQTLPEAIKMISANDGHRYLLFAIAPEHDFGPMPPPEFLNAVDKHHPGPAHHPLGHAPPKPPSPLPLIVAGLLSSLLFSAALAWYFAKPIRHLRDAFAAAANGDLEQRIAKSMGKRHDELADLGRDFDHMATQLDNLITAQQRLLHDVSHELRSPLARMQAAIGLAQQQPEKMRASLERIERESQRISDLIGELLILSRLEAGVGEGEIIDTDLGDLLGDIIEDARFEAGQKGINIHYRGFEEDAIVKTHCELLHRAVENVLRNAVQHCEKDGEVNVTAKFDAVDGRLQIGIDDQGPGVDKADLQSIFQPFFRGKYQNKPDSIGLGLTIALRAVEALGGTISAHNKQQSGLYVEISIPFRQTQA